MTDTEIKTIKCSLGGEAATIEVSKCACGDSPGFAKTTITAAKQVAWHLDCSCGLGVKASSISQLQETWTVLQAYLARKTSLTMGQTRTAI
jgi:hypothetical protein